ncbi:MAG: hypothetical protein K2I67_03135, partial [Malacoplasma sp.]|nr:hypothetical protein [Malacoplasma sp.]
NEVMTEKKNVPFNEVPINSVILLDLIKSDNDNAFSFSSASREDALNIILDNKKGLSDESINTIASFYDIRGREFMSSKEQRKVLKLLAEVNVHNKIITMNQVSNHA